jgi:hypothetical protein
LARELRTLPLKASIRRGKRRKVTTDSDVLEPMS